MTSRTPKLLCAAAAIAFLSTSASAVTLYEDNFDGGTGDLNGTTPDTTTAAATWVAADTWDANGSVGGASTGDSATLAFAPVDGLIYTLDVSLGATTYPAGPDNDWFAIGFGNGQTTGKGTTHRFINGSLIGKAWMLQRGPSGGVNRTWLGTATAGTQNGEDWTAQTTLTGGNADLRIVLNTTGGAGAWTAEFLAKGSGDASYSVVRAAQVLADEGIDSVGIARSSNDINGTITSFSLTSEVPEPSSLALLGLGGLLMARRRR